MMEIFIKGSNIYDLKITGEQQQQQQGLHGDWLNLCN
jgi:hypothetical protein